MIDTVLYPDVWTLWLHRLIGPLVTCLLYVFVYPYPERWAFSWAKKKQRDLKTIQASLDSDVPLTPEQSRELRLKCKKAVEETQSLIKEHQDKVLVLTNEIANLKGEIFNKDNEIDQLAKRAGKISLSNTHASILRVLKIESMKWDELKVQSGINSIIADDTVNDLAGLGCIRPFDCHTTGGTVRAWAITQLGLQALSRKDEETGSEEMTLSRPTLRGA